MKTLKGLCICAHLKIKTSKNVELSDVPEGRALSITRITEISQVDPELTGSSE